MPQRNDPRTGGTLRRTLLAKKVQLVVSRSARISKKSISKSHKKSSRKTIHREGSRDPAGLPPSSGRCRTRRNRITSCKRTGDVRRKRIRRKGFGRSWNLQKNCPTHENDRNHHQEEN